MSTEIKPTVYQMFERNIGDRVRVVTKNDLGFEGVLSTVSKNPPGVWLSEAEVVVLRSTVVNPLPHVVNRENKSELFIHLSSVQRVEVLHNSESG